MKFCCSYNGFTKGTKTVVAHQVETVNSFESWRQNLQDVLSLDPNFAPFLVSGASWEKKTKSNATKGFENDTAPIPTERRKTAARKVTLLELMLSQIASFCPVISRNTVIRSSTSIDSIWQLIRAHYGFQSTGAHFLDLADFKLEQDERPEDLFQPLTAFFDYNLLSTTGGLSHHGEVPTENEYISFTRKYNCFTLA